MSCLYSSLIGYSTDPISVMVPNVSLQPYSKQSAKKKISVEVNLRSLPDFLGVEASLDKGAIRNEGGQSRRKQQTCFGEL